MSFPTSSQITDMTNVSMGQLAQILFSKGFTSQMNRTFKDFDAVLMALKQPQPTTEREYRYLLLTALGVNAAQYTLQGQPDVAFPSGDLGTTQEVTAVMKKIQATIELDRNVWERVKLAQFKYVDNPLAVEIQNKLDVVKRMQARAMYGDGSGALGIVGSTSVSSGKLIISLSTADSAIGGGNTNWFHKGEKIAFCTSAGVAQTALATATPVVYFTVDSTDRKNRQITLTGYSGAGAILTITAADLIGAGDLIYPVNVLSSFAGPDLTASPDWGKVTPVMAGLESLSANDGRTVFGVTMSGQVAGSRFDHGGGIFDVSAIEESMNEVEQNVGAGKYKYDNLIMPYNAFSALIEGKEADRRFNSVEDNARGGRKFIYQYGDQSLDCIKSYFCPFNRIYSLPKPATGEMGETGYAIEFRGTEFMDVTAGGQKEFLKLSGGQYANTIQSFLEAYAVMIAKQPAAINVISNFTMA